MQLIEPKSRQRHVVSNSFFIISTINFYFISSLLVRNILILHLSIPFPTLDKPIISAEIVICWLIALLLVLFSHRRLKSTLSKNYGHQTTKISNKLLIIFSFCMSISVATIFKYISSGMSYEQFHMFLSQSLFGKIQYLIILSLVIQVYVVLYTPSRFLAKCLLFQIFAFTLLLEQRSYTLIALIILSYHPQVSRYIITNKLKILAGLIMVVTLPLFLRSGMTVISAFYQIIAAGAFQFDLFTLSQKNSFAAVSRDYVQRGGGYGSFFPSYLYEIFGSLSLYIWLILPIIIRLAPVAIGAITTVYYFTIVRNHPDSWLNGYLVFTLVLILASDIIPKKTNDYK